MLVSLASPLLRLSGRFQMRFCENLQGACSASSLPLGMRSFFVGWRVRLLFRIVLPDACGYSVRGRRWSWDFLKYVITDTLDYAIARDPPGVEGRWQCRLLAVHFSLLSARRHQPVRWCTLHGVPQVRAVPNGTAQSVLILTGIVSGAAGHNRGGVVETPLLARTQGGNIGGARRSCF